MKTTTYFMVFMCCLVWLCLCHVQIQEKTLRIVVSCKSILLPSQKINFSPSFSPPPPTHLDSCQKRFCWEIDLISTIGTRLLISVWVAQEVPVLPSLWKGGNTWKSSLFVVVLDMKRETKWFVPASPSPASDVFLVWRNTQCKRAAEILAKFWTSQYQQERVEWGRDRETQRNCSQTQMPQLGNSSPGAGGKCMAQAWLRV